MNPILGCSLESGGFEPISLGGKRRLYGTPGYPDVSRGFLLNHDSRHFVAFDQSPELGSAKMPYSNICRNGENGGSKISERRNVEDRTILQLQRC